MNKNNQEEYFKRSEQIDKAREEFENIFLTIPSGIRTAAERLVKKGETTFMIIVIAGLAYCKHRNNYLLAKTHHSICFFTVNAAKRGTKI